MARWPAAGGPTRTCSLNVAFTVEDFEPAEIERLLREQGFDDVIHFGPD